MIKPFIQKPLFHVMCVSSLLAFSVNAQASAFQLWEQDAASVGDYHAGRAAEANDASIAFYNPAGITRIKNQQIVLGDVGILTDLKYRGSVGVNTLNGGIPQGVVAQGGTFSQVPNLHYVAPLTENLGFGLSITVPFGLKTNYGTNTPLQYAATLTEIQVVDVSPSLGFNISKKLSLGVGLDWQRMSAELDQTDVLFFPATHTRSVNKGWSTAYGFHVGALYQFEPNTRVGLAYNSQVVHHIRGTSKFVGPIANLFTFLATGTPSSIVSREANASITLPPYTTLSAYHQFNDKWALMGTAIYTQWNVVTNLFLKDQAGINSLGLPAKNINVNIIQNYHNTWNFSVGGNYFATEKLTLRAGVGFDQTPTTNQYRIVEIPDNNRYAVAFGGHYQSTKALGFDLGWTHLFIPNANISPPPLAVGAEVQTTNGTTSGSADVFGAQVTWTLA